MKQFRNKRLLEKEIQRADESSPFAILPIIPHILIFAAVIIGYNYIVQNNLYPMYFDDIHLGAKILIALVIIFGSTKSYVFPLVTLLVAGADLYMIHTYYHYIITMADAVQLIIGSVVGVVLAIIVRL